MSKRYILPIFLLYTITSVLFLAFFATFYYKDAKRDIYEKMAHEMRASANDIEFMLRINDGIDEILELESGYEMNILDMKNGEFALKTFEKPRYKGHFFIDKNFMYFSDLIHSNSRTFIYDLQLRTNEPKKLIQSLFYKLCITCAILLIAIFVIAYFIVRLSYLPLFNQIKALNNFISDTTHEINTPLSVILMSVEIFDKNPQKYLSNIKIAAKTLSNLYGDLAANLKNQENKIEILNLNDILLERLEFFSQSMENKGLSVNSDLSEVKIKSDAQKIKKIIDNLLSNAVKYSFQGKEIKIKLCPEKFEISNYSETISKQNLSKIYDKFSRFDTQNGGFGIGLSLVKRYCDELGIKIECESKRNQTTFCLRFK